MNEREARSDRFGIWTMLAGIALFLLAAVLFVVPLDRKIDTLLVMAWLFLPAAVAGWIYTNIARADGWSIRRRLK